MNLNFDEFIEVKQAQQKPKEEHPKGFKPGVEWNGNKGQITNLSIVYFLRKFFRSSLIL